VNPDRRNDRTGLTRSGDDAGRRRGESAEETPTLDSGVLLGANGRLRIRHHGQTYELRETRFGKLILTK